MNTDGKSRALCDFPVDQHLDARGRMNRRLQVVFPVLLASFFMLPGSPVRSMACTGQVDQSDRQPEIVAVGKTGTRVQIGFGLEGIVVSDGNSERRFSNQYETAELLGSELSGFWILLFEGNTGTGSFERIGLLINSTTGEMERFVLFESRHTGFLPGEGGSALWSVSFQLKLRENKYCEPGERAVSAEIIVAVNEVAVLEQTGEGCLSAAGVSVSTKGDLLRRVMERVEQECLRSEAPFDRSPQPCFGANEILYDLVMAETEIRRLSR